MNEINATWLALLFDTEGSFSLNKGSHQSAERPAKRGFSWIPKASVINTYKPLLEKAQVICEGMGRLSKHGSSSYRTENKIQYTWTLRSTEMKSILPQIIPFLMEKRERAELLLEAVESFDICKGLGLNPITPYRDQRLETIFWRMRYLNARKRDGKGKVKLEEAQHGHVPYSREEFSHDAEVVQRTSDEKGYQNQLRLSREWKERNREQQREYWKEWEAKKKKDPEYMAKRRVAKQESDAKLREQKSKAR